MANTVTLGIGKQTGFGTANTTYTAIKVFDSIDVTPTINRIENQEMFGGLDTFAGENGTEEVSVSVEGNVYPQAIGYFLQMIAGNPTTTGSDDYTHTFQPSDTLPVRYTFGLDEQQGVEGHARDVLLSNLTISQDTGDYAKFSASGIGSTFIAASTSVSLAGVETRPFRFTDFSASVKIGEASAAAYTTFKSFNFSVDNPVSNIFTLNGERTAYGQEFTGRRAVNFDGTLYFTNAQAAALRTAWAANTNIELELEWEIDADTSLAISIPQARIIGTPAWTRGYGETELTFAAQGFYDATLEGSVEVVLKNQKATY